MSDYLFGSFPIVSVFLKFLAEATGSAATAADPAPAPAQPAAESSDSIAKKPRDLIAEAKRHCELIASKGPAIRTCFDNAKRWIEYYRAHPEELPKPKTPLEQEMARCETIGKPAAMMACKREAPARVEARRKAAEEAAKDTRTPLQKALDRCQFLHSKMPQVMQCKREAHKQYNSGH